MTSSRAQVLLCMLICRVATAQNVTIVVKPPTVRNIWNSLSIFYSLTNTGTVPAANVLVRQITLDDHRESQLALPWSLGDIAPVSQDGLHPVRQVYLLAGFSLDGLAVGEKHALTVKGTYELNLVTYPFTLNAVVTVPAPEALPMPTLPPSIPQLKNFDPKVLLEQLASRVEVAAQVNDGLWTYTLFNDEKPDSNRYITSFQVIMAAPFVVRETPKGWTVMTDNHHFVLWSADGTDLPNMHDLAPGKSVGGFQIHSASGSSEGNVYSTHSWNHKTNTADRLKFGTVLTPARPR